MVEILETDLLADISRKELDGLAKKLVELGDPDPITVTITEQRQKVDDYTRRFDLPPDREKRLIRALALFELMARLGAIPEKRQTKYDEAMKELRDIRDGKFPDLLRKDPAPAGLSDVRGRFGSQPRLAPR